MNIQERIERIEALEAEFNERLKALKVEVQQEQKFPQDGDEYWYIDDEGDILSEWWEGVYFEENRLVIGNFFQTEEQAEFTVEKLKVEAELRKFSRPLKPWSNNYVVTLASRGELEMKNVAFTNYQGAIHFESGEKAQQAVNSIGEERIKKYIFGVED